MRQRYQTHRGVGNLGEGIVPGEDPSSNGNPGAIPNRRCARALAPGDKLIDGIAAG